MIIAIYYHYISKVQTHQLIFWCDLLSSWIMNWLFTNLFLCWNLTLSKIITRYISKEKTKFWQNDYIKLKKKLPVDKLYFCLFVYYHAWQTDEFHPNKNNDGTLLLEHLALFTPIEEAWQNWTVQFMIWKKKSTRYGTLLVQLYNIIYNAPASHFNISQVTQRNKEVHAKLRTNPKYYRVYINQSNPHYPFPLDSTNSHPLSLSILYLLFFLSSFAWTERERERETRKTIFQY